MKSITLIYTTLVLFSTFALAVETKLSTSPNNQLEIYAIGDSASHIKEFDGVRAIGKLHDELILNFRDVKGVSIGKLKVSMLPVMSYWNYDSKSVIIREMGYRSNWRTRCYLISDKVIKEIKLQEKELVKVLINDNRPREQREWDGGAIGNNLSADKRKWIFSPVSWSKEGLLLVSAIELSRDTKMPHPFQQQTCSYRLSLDPKSDFEPIQLEATSEKNRSTFKPIWKKANKSQ